MTRSEAFHDRVAVWEALADFWVDTDLAPFEIDHIARVIAASPYSIAEIKAIHDYEVAPAVWSNLLSPAGEWTGFDSEWLVERCRSCAARRHSFRFRATMFLQLPFIRRLAARYWEQVLPRVEALRKPDNAEMGTDRVPPEPGTAYHEG